ncbi:hypothetical protein [Flavobacterium ichthyis]|uniref:hypothetical protein n=1 Tax=Flavobacterium ichthyis TaxID=2698827 RepID=UPI001F2AAAE5|nr:hypothetical protein [Flavobacterium ichthyis]
MRLQKFSFFIVFLMFQFSGIGQLHLKIEGSIEAMKVADSIGFEKKHANVKSVLDEADAFLDKARKRGFLESKFLGSRRENDSVFVYDFVQGNFTKFIHIYR